MPYILSVLMGYLLGCVNPAYFLSRAKGVDLRKNGSGNLGASNTAVVLGWPSAVLVAAYDISKGALAVLLARMLFPQTEAIGAVAGAAAILGHIFPFYLGFRGGKGFASYIGMMFLLQWKIALLTLALGLLITLVTDFIALATISTAVVFPTIYLWQNPALIPAVMFVVLAGVIIYKHKDNISRIRKGTEIGLRSTAKGENRVK